MSQSSSENLEDLLAELLLSEDSASERFLVFLVMEPFIRIFRSQGLSNKDILEICERIDEERDV